MKAKLFIPAIAWFIISIILLIIPGNDLPQNDLFKIPFFDKYVHCGMFFLLTTLFCYPFLKLPSNYAVVIAWFFKITILVILYGIAMEFVQKYWVPGRSFDVYDIVVDSFGSLAGLVTSRQYYVKKIGPDGNQGRNQN